HQVNPIHGGGIALAMDAGKIAGNVASDALSKGNVSKESLYEYQRLWGMKFGNKLKSLLRLRSFLERVTDDEFEIFADILSGEDIIKLTKSKYRFLIKLLMKKAPHMLPLAKRFLS
ncbi:MAG: NAD(P)/FAD-dependent oxidoreductase, partial [Candidatus Altiarchaeales archaeon]